MMFRTVIFLFILLMLDLYVGTAVKSLSSRKWILYAFWILNFLSYIFLLLYFTADLRNNSSKILAIYPGAFIFIWYFSKLFFVPFLLIDDLRRGVSFAYAKLTSADEFDAGRSKVLMALGLGFFIFPFSTLFYGIVRNPYRYTVHEVDVEIVGLPLELEGFKIVQISDIHSGTFVFKEAVRRGVEMINALEPDVFVFTGDLVNTFSYEIDDYIEVFDKIQAKFGKYSILGNHDYGDYHDWPTVGDKDNNFNHLLDVHKRLGWDLLLNEHRNIEVSGHQISVIGVENFSASSRFPKHGDLIKATANLPLNSIKVLLTHDPSHWRYEVVEKYKEISLTLSGHTHGFQYGIEIPGFVSWSPSKYIYKEWAGLYREGEQNLYVNRGFGVLGYPGRVGILPEITKIVLKRKK